MKRIFTVLFLTVAFAGMHSTVHAQKIGYISADEIIQLMPEAAEVQTKLDQFQQSLYQNAQDKRATFDEAVQKFYKDSATMNASLKEVKRTELQKQVAELGAEEQRIAQQFEQKRYELSLPVQKKLQTAIEEVAKEKGYTYVLPKEALIVMPPADDIGPLVIKKLGLKEPAAKPATGGK